MPQGSQSANTQDPSSPQTARARTLIDGPNPYGSAEELETFLAQLQNEPDTPEVREAMEEAQRYLSDRASAAARQSSSSS